MAAAVPLLSIVCPAYQEEEVLPLFHRELAAILLELRPEFEVEIIYVDDGSSDATLEVLRELAAADRQVRYVSLSRNFGHQAALTAGLDDARGDVVVTMDSDLQHPPRLIPELLAQWRKGFDIVLTIRADDDRLGLTKRLTSKLFYRLMHAVSDTDIRDGASDFRLMSRKAVEALLRLKERHRLLRGMVRWLGFKTAEVSFQPDARKAGKTKYTLRRMIGLAGEGLFSFSRIPLRLASCLGALAVLIGLGHAVWFLFAALRGDTDRQTGAAYLLISTHLLSGALLCAVGILGEYIGRIFEQVKDRPLYLIKEKSPNDSNSASSAREAFAHHERDAA